VPLGTVPQFQPFNKGTNRNVVLTLPMFSSEKLPAVGTIGDPILIDSRY
jgi:hypothetical protein